MLVHTFKPQTGEAETGGSLYVKGLPDLHMQNSTND